MKRVWVIVETPPNVAPGVKPEAAAQAQTSASTLMGMVRSASGERMEGVTVSDLGAGKAAKLEFRTRAEYQTLKAATKR